MKTQPLVKNADLYMKHWKPLNNEVQPKMGEQKQGLKVHLKSGLG